VHQHLALGEAFEATCIVDFNRLLGQLDVHLLNGFNLYCQQHIKLYIIIISHIPLLDIGLNVLGKIIYVHCVTLPGFML
jgi:hypothetical protein